MKYVPERRRNPFVTSRTGGRVLSAMMLPWFRLLPPPGYGVLTTIGRKTGKRRPRCMRVIRRGQRAHMVAIGGDTTAWLKNLRANPNVSLRMKGGTFAVRARELSDAVEVEQEMEAFCETVNVNDYFACALHRTGWPTKSKIKELNRTWVRDGTPLVVEFDSGPAHETAAEPRGSKMETMRER